MDLPPEARPRNVMTPYHRTLRTLPGCREYLSSLGWALRRATACRAFVAASAEPWHVAFPGAPIPAAAFGRFDLGAWLFPSFCTRSMRGMIKLAEDQQGGLTFGDRLITAGAVPDRFRLLGAGLC